jgi:hypothetical protein
MPENNSIMSAKTADISRLRDAYNYFAQKNTEYETLNSAIAKRASLDVGTRDFGRSLFFGPTLLLMIIEYFRSKKNKKRLEAQISEIQGALTPYYRAYMDCPVAFEYSSPAYLAELIRLMESGRADSIKEAINIAIDDNHKRNLLNMQHDIARNTASAARSARSAATASWLSFWWKK